MSYAVKEIFLTLQGEGVQAGRRAVFLRFAGCNLWSGLEKDRMSAICQFCDTDFVGMDGENGARYADADMLADKVAALWGEGKDRRYVVMTGGEPMLQVDDALVAALHARGFEIAMESNGTIAAQADIDWICISPKAGSDVVQRHGNELKLIWPHIGRNGEDSDTREMESWNFDHFLIQPLDSGDQFLNMENVKVATDFVQANPKWRVSLQNHKILGLP